MAALPFHTTFFFFNDTATTEIYTLSLHDALPISRMGADKRTGLVGWTCPCGKKEKPRYRDAKTADRKSTRLNSSHLVISYAVFCLKKKKFYKLSTWRRSRPNRHIYCCRLPCGRHH